MTDGPVPAPTYTDAAIRDLIARGNAQLTALRAEEAARARQDREEREERERNARYAREHPERIGHIHATDSAAGRAAIEHREAWEARQRNSVSLELEGPVPPAPSLDRSVERER